MDVLIVAKSFTNSIVPKYDIFAETLFVSKSAAHDSVRRAQEARLLNADRTVVPRAAAELFAFGVRYLIPAQLGPVTRGVPTSFGVSPLLGYFGARSDAPVWPVADSLKRGMARGPALEPIYETVPQVVEEDIVLYGLLALIDATRVGRAREIALARMEIKKIFGVDEW